MHDESIRVGATSRRAAGFDPPTSGATPTRRSRRGGGGARDADAARLGVFVGFELRGRRFDYWAGLVREGEPYLYIEELDGTGLRGGLEIKPPRDVGRPRLRRAVRAVEPRQRGARRAARRPDRGVAAGARRRRCRSRSTSSGTRRRRRPRSTLDPGARVPAGRRGRRADRADGGRAGVRGPGRTGARVGRAVPANIVRDAHRSTAACAPRTAAPTARPSIRCSPTRWWVSR